MIQLPPTEFTFGKYGLDIPFNIRMDDGLLVDWLLDKTIIGYCNSLECKIRPRINQVAIMVEVDNWIAWTHIPIRIFNKIKK
jgi:hypothetical protein